MHLCLMQPTAILQEFCLLKVLEDASKAIFCVSWSAQLLATAGNDKIVRIYDASQDLGWVCKGEKLSWMLPRCPLQD